MWWRFLPPFYHFGSAFRPQIVKVGALSALTQEILLKYSLDLPYIQIVKETIGVGVNEKAVLRFYQTALSFTSISIFPW